MRGYPFSYVVTSWGLAISLIYMLVGCTVVPLSRRAETPVVAEATAKDCEAALRQAKVEAVDNVAGTFVHGQRSLLDDKDYSESLKEYTSGVVRRYNVIEEVRGNPCRIKIEAWVDPERGRVDFRGRSESVSVEDINGRARQLHNNQGFLDQHFRNTQDFQVLFSHHEVMSAQSNGMRVALDLAAINPSPMWLEDLEKFISVHARPVVYEPVGRSSSSIVFSGVSQAEQKGKPTGAEFEICFNDTKKLQIRCYTGDQNRKIIRTLRSSVVEIVVKTADGNRLNSLWPFQSAYYTHVNMSREYRALGYQGRSDFPMVALSPSVTRISFDYSGSQLPAGATIEGRFRFVNLDQF